MTKENGLFSLRLLQHCKLQSEVKFCNQSCESLWGEEDITAKYFHIRKLATVNWHQVHFYDFKRVTMD